MAKNCNIKRNRNNTRSNSPTIDKDREYFRKKLSANRNADVRYWKNIKDIKEKFTYPFGCNQERCPSMKQRLDLHTREHHYEGLADALSVTPKPKTVRNPKSISSTSYSTQTSSLQDQSERTENAPVITTPVLRDPSLYKVELDKIVMKWIQFVPLYPYTTDENEVDNAVTSLINDINNLANDVKHKDYEKNVKSVIDHFLNAPGMWYPNVTKEDQILMKDVLRNYLWKSIIEINENQFVNNRGDDNIVINNYNENEVNHNYVYSGHKNWDVRFSMNENKDGVENEIRTWLNELKQTHRINNARLNKKETVQFVLTRLTDLLDQQTNTNYKTVLKRKIADILNELQICSYYPKNRKIDIETFAESLTNKIITIQTKNNSFKINNSSSYTVINKRNNTQIMDIANGCSENNDLKHTLQDVVSECLDKGNDNNCSDIVEDTTDIIVKNLDCFKTKEENFVKAQISNLLRRSCDVSVFKASNIAQQIVDIANDIISHDDAVASTTGLVRPCLSGVISVYASTNNSKQSVSPKPLASSTLNFKTKKDIEKLNPEERSYGDKLLKLIKAWINTLPEQFHMPEDQNFKETIIQDLVGNIVEGAKLDQLSVALNKPDQQKLVRYYVLQWLQKFQICSDIDSSMEQTKLLVDKILTIPVPILTRSQHGTRKHIEHLKFRDVEENYSFDFVPNVTHILEDEISIWMNEQPSEIYAINDKSIRGKMVQELAAKVRTPLAEKRPHTEISNEVAKWLSGIVKPGQKNNVRQLSENLKDRIIKLPQDQTLAKEKIRQYDKGNKNNSIHGSPPSVHPANPSVDDNEKTLNEFIGRYIEHNYNVDDSFARGAFTNLLKTEIIRLNPPTRKEVYDNFMKTGQRDFFSTERLDKELQYIKIVADWLKKTIPFLPGCTVGDNFIVELTTTLAKDIYETEARRVIAPEEMNHDAYLKSIILVYLFELPIDRKKMKDQMVTELLDKIIATRQTNQSEPCCKASTINTKNVYRKDEIANFIEDYVQESSKVLDEDEVKKKACSVRVLKEIKQVVQETADPEILSKEKVYENINEVPVSRDEAIIRFNLALDYAHEISEWIKNLPILEVSNDPVERQALIYKISVLAKKMVIRHYKKVANPMNTQVDAETVGFVQKWILELPIEPQKEIVYPVVISQLMNRIKKVDMKLQGEKTNLEKIEQKINKSINETRNTQQRKPKVSISARNPPPGKTGESLLVDAVEQWANGLPIKSDNDIETKAIKDNVAKNLYQKIGELNVDPRSHNDDLLFQEMVADEIDIQLENLPQYTELQNNREKLKGTLLEAVMEAKKIMKVTSAGDIYRHKLEKTIESSFPYPVQNQNYDPAFEIYKNRLAEEFILENFDHGNDAVKNNYVKRIKYVIDKYFQSAQNKNAIPLSKDQIYNELYSSLFKVPIPNENSIVEEVEEVKTKCEIEKWFQQLPLRPNTGVDELLEWDKILSMLAKRIHEIEKTEPEPDEKIHKEIKKWLIQLPLLPGQEANIDQLTNNLQELLKITTKSRKFVPMPKDESFVPPKTNKINMDRVNKSRNIGVSKMDWPSRAGRKWVTSSNVFDHISCQAPPTPRQRNSAEIMNTIVKSWCDKLPIKGDTIQEQVEACSIIDDLKSRIMLKIRELNSIPAVLENDIVYNDLFNDALENLLSTLPPNSEFQQTKEERKIQLIQDIIRYIPLVIEEKSRQEYKEELNKTVSGILGGPHHTTADMAGIFDKIKEEIVENFVELNYNKDDDEGKQAYKMLIHEAVIKYFSEIVQKWDNPSDILMKRNELICELSKIPVPITAVLKQEVEEIRMKNEVRDFFNELSLPEESKENMALREQVKTNLAKMLNDIEKGGHNSSNDNKMKEEISRCLKKLNIQVDPEVINAFVNKLKNDETERKAPPPRKESETLRSPCQAVQGNVPICTRTALPSNSRDTGAGVVLSSSVGHLGTLQLIPVVADGSIHRPILSTSVLQPGQVVANEMVVPQVVVTQPAPCQQTVPCLQPVPNFPIGQLLGTVQTSGIGQGTDTAPTTGLYEQQPMALASEPNRWQRDIRTEATRETRPGAHRQGRPRGRPSSEEDEECICESRRRPRTYRNRPPCYYPRGYYENCEDMVPPWFEKGGHKNDHDIKKKIERCLKLLNIEANPEVINGYLNNLQSEQNERQVSQRDARMTAPTVLPTVPSCGQTIDAGHACSVPIGPTPSQNRQAIINRTFPLCAQASSASQACALPLVPNSCQGVQANIPKCSHTTLPSNIRVLDGNYPGSSAGVVLSSSVGQLYGAQQPIVENRSQPPPCQQPCSIQVPNINQIPTNIPEVMPQVLPCGQLLSTVQTSSPGTTPTTRFYDRQPMAAVPESNRLRETRSGVRREGKPRSRPSSKESDEDEYDGRRRWRNRRKRPRFYYPRGYCDDCEDMVPPWWGMSHPGFFY